MDTLTAILGGGVGGALAAAGIMFVLKTWLGKQIEASIEHEYGKKLANHEGLIQRELEAHRNTFSKEQRVHATQLETEYKIYREIWESVLFVGRSVSTLLPMLDQYDMSRPFKEVFTERLEKLCENYNRLNDATYKNRPFYSDEIFKLCVDLLKVAHQSIGYGQMVILRSLKRDPDIDTKHYEKMEEKTKKFDAAIMPMIRKIRARIYFEFKGEMDSSMPEEKNASLEAEVDISGKQSEEDA